MDVNLYWDAVKAWDGEKGLLNTTEAAANGSYEVWFKVPEAVNGSHYLWVKDTDTGSTLMWSTPFTVIPKIKVSPSSGLVDDTVTIKGYGFSPDEAEVDVTFNASALTTSPSTPETNDLGSWSATFKVPFATYGVYVINATDENNVTAVVNFTIGAAITITPEEGPVGTVVQASGRGFQVSGEVDSIKLDSIDCTNTTSLDINSKGKSTIKFVIPLVADTGDYTVTIADGTGNSSTAAFEVTGLPKIEVDPSYGIQGITVSVHGYNFTAISGEDVEVTINGIGPKTLETSENGEFSGSYTIPANLAPDTYNLTATQTKYGIDAKTNFRVGMMLVILTPSEGPTGTQVTITGTGFTEGKKWNATFGDIALELADDMVDTGGTISEPFYVPTVDVGTYTVTVMDIDTEIEVTDEFEVTYTTLVTVDPTTAPNDYNVTIEGWYFTAHEDTTLTFVLYNSTDDLDMSVVYEGAAVVTDEDGNFTGYWKVPDSDTLSLGDYMINVTDSEDLFAQFAFSVVAKTISITPRKSAYAIGDIVAFNIESSFTKPDSYIKIKDPDSNLYWKTDLFEAGDWLKVGTVQTVPYYSQVAGGNPMVLASDAPLGTWSYTFYDNEDEVLDTGTFTVSAAPSEVIGERISDLNATITDLRKQLSDMGEATSTDISDMGSKVEALKAEVEALKADIPDTVDESVTAAMADVDKTIADLETSIASSQAAAEEAKAATKGLSTLVYAAIGASLIAALAAIVSLMQISRRIAG